MRGTVESVRREPAGSVLASVLSPSDTVVEVTSARDFSDDGATHPVTVGGTSLTYSDVLWADVPEDGVSVDTLVLTGAAGVTKPARTTRVNVPGAVEYIAQVREVGTNVSSEATIVHHLIDKDALKVAAVSDGALVQCEWRGHGHARKLWLTEILKREPLIDLAFALAGSARSAVMDLSDPAWSTFILGVVGPYLGGGGGTGGIDIDCGDATAAGVDIDCGGA